MDSASAAAAYNWGCSQGDFDRTNGSNSDDTLDFGGMNANNTVTYSPLNPSLQFSVSSIESLSEQFAWGYWNCTTTKDDSTVLVLQIGTNNAEYVDASGADIWAWITIDVRNWVHSSGFQSQIDVLAADDIEDEWSSQASAEAWVNSYDGCCGGSNASPQYVDFGDAGGCPPYGTCNNGWSQNGIWFVSWGATKAESVPEIYYQTTAYQWFQVARYSFYSEADRMYIMGPLDEYDEDTSSFTAAQAWAALSNALEKDQNTNTNMTFSDEIHTE